MTPSGETRPGPVPPGLTPPGPARAGRTPPRLTRAGAVGTLVWVVLALIAAIVVARARYTTDLSAFLPKSPTATQRLLVDQLRDGLASRLIIVAIDGADSQTRARVSVAMANSLRSADALFVSVNNGESSGTDRDRAFLFSHR
jgi:predicted exporter